MAWYPSPHSTQDESRATLLTPTYKDKKVWSHYKHCILDGSEEEALLTLDLQWHASFVVQSTQLLHVHVLLHTSSLWWQLNRSVEKFFNWDSTCTFHLHVMPLVKYMYMYQVPISIKQLCHLYKGQPTEDYYNKSHKYVPMWPWNSAVCTPWSPVSADQDPQCQHKFHREPSPASSPTPWDPRPPEEYQPLHGTGGRKDTLVHNYMSYLATTSKVPNRASLLQTILPPRPFSKTGQWNA